VVLRAGEALDMDLDQLKEYARTSIVESHDTSSEKMEFKLGRVFDLISGYSATFPPGILQ
jgi:hypothetical protein